jgi:hypothetical protein
MPQTAPQSITFPLSTNSVEFIPNSALFTPFTAVAATIEPTQSESSKKEINL